MPKREKRKRLGFKSSNSKRVFVSPTIMGSSRLFSSAWLLSGRSHAQVFFVLLPTSCPGGHFSEEGARLLTEISHFLKGKKVELAPPPSIPRMKTNGPTERVENCGKAGAVVLSDNFFLPSSEASWHQWREEERGSFFLHFVCAFFWEICCSRVIISSSSSELTCFAAVSFLRLFPRDFPATLHTPFSRFFPI